MPKTCFFLLSSWTWSKTGVHSFTSFVFACQLQSQSTGASVNSTCAGGYLHADDNHTLASSPTTLEAQVSSLVTQFTKEDFLNLNASNRNVQQVLHQNP